MTAMILLTSEELAKVVREAVRAELGTRPSDEREVLTRDDAAALLDVHRGVILRYVRTAGLPAYKIGPEWRFKRSELLAWLEARAATPGGQPTKAARKIRSLKGDE